MTKGVTPLGSGGQTPDIPRYVFITGASGFTGCALARYRALDAEVRGMDLLADSECNVAAGG